MGAQGKAPGADSSHREILIKYRSGALEGERTRARGLARGHLTRKHRLINEDAFLEVLTIPSRQNVSTAIRTVRADPAVEYAEVNWTYKHFTAPSDPYFGYLWGLDNTGQSVAGRTGAADADIDAVEGWSRTSGSPQVYVAVLDEGIDIAHPDLGTEPYGPIWTNPYDPVDGIDNDGNGYVDDRHGFDFAANDRSVYDGTPVDVATDAHGTHVAGTIGARANNGIGIAGVSWDVGIIPAKFISGGYGTTEGAIRAIDYIVDLKTRHGLNIVAINASWGGGGYSQALLDALARAARADILFIAAAGNGAGDMIGDDNDQIPVYPANYDTTALAGYDAVISVAATGMSDEFASFSNFGVRAVDLAAPGVYILSTTPQNGYGYSSGTSMAVPHVTGTAALVAAASGAKGRELRSRLLSSVDTVPSVTGRAATDGRLNLATALGGVPALTSPPPSLPEPWRAEDIGAVGATGRSSESGGTFTLVGAGADVWGTADAFQFAYQPMPGDGTIIARVGSVQSVHAWTKAGVMIRGSSSPSSAHAFLLVSPGKGVAFQRRASGGEGSVHTPGTFTTAPRWLRLVRVGGTITASESADGTAWTPVGSATIALGETAYVGLALTSHVAGTLAQAQFDNVSVSLAPVYTAPPVTWSSVDIGAVGYAGSATEVNGTFSIAGSGADIWGTSDQLHYMHQPLTGDGTIVAKVASIQNTNVWVKAGVMIRETLAPDSPHAMMIVTPGGTKGLAFQRRVSTSGISTHTSGGGGMAPAWVKLERQGTTISAYRSADGAAWTLVGRETFAMRSTVHVGLVVSSHDNAVLARATFDRVSVTR